MNNRIRFKHAVGVVAAIFLWIGSGVTGIAHASQGESTHDKSIMSTVYKVRTADTNNLPTLSKSDSKGDWVCPMHSEVHKHEPGKCPICKMSLVKAKHKSE